MSRKISFLYIAQDKFSRVTNKISKSSSRLNGKLKTLRVTHNRLSSAFKKSLPLFSSIKKNFLAIAAATAGVVLGIKKIVSVGSEFEDAMADLSAITGATGEDFELLIDKSFKLSKASITGQADVAKGIKLIASAKPELLKNLPALIATTEAVLLLKNTGIDLESAVTATVGGLNAFGESAEFASRNVNILAAGSKFGSSEVRETAEALKLAGPGAKAAGLSFLDLNVAIQALAKAGIKGSQSGTALNAMFARLQLSGKSFRKLGLEGVFKAVSSEIKSISDPLERAATEFELFGLEHAKSGLAMLDNIPVIKELTVSMADTDAAAEQAKIRMATFSKQMELTGIIINEKLIKTFNAARVGVDFAGKSIKEFSEGFDKSDIEAFGLVLSGLGTILAGLIKIFSFGFTIIMGVIKPVLSILKGIGEIIGQVIGALATLNFSGLSKTFSFEGLKESFSIGEKFLGLFGDNKLDGNLNTSQSSRTDVNVNLRAPEGAVQSVKSQTSGKVSGLNVGVSMATAQ